MPAILVRSPAVDRMMGYLKSVGGVDQTVFTTPDERGVEQPNILAAREFAEKVRTNLSMTMGEPGPIRVDVSYNRVILSLSKERF